MEMVFAPKKAKNAVHFPRLDTVLMVEKAIYDNRSDKTVFEIWRTLPKKVMWRTFCMIADYLEHSGKIHVEKDRTVSWIWNPAGVENLKKRGLVVA